MYTDVRLDDSEKVVEVPPPPRMSDAKSAFDSTKQSKRLVLWKRFASERPPV